MAKVIAFPGKSEIKHPGDVHRLPWKGNGHPDDKPLIQMVDNYQVREPDEGKAWSAVRHMSKRAWGKDLSEKPSQKDLKFVADKMRGS